MQQKKAAEAAKSAADENNTFTTAPAPVLRMASRRMMNPLLSAAVANGSGGAAEAVEARGAGGSSHSLEDSITGPTFLSQEFRRPSTIILGLDLAESRTSPLMDEEYDVGGGGVTSAEAVHIAAAAAVESESNHRFGIMVRVECTSCMHRLPSSNRLPKYLVSCSLEDAAGIGFIALRTGHADDNLQLVICTRTYSFFYMLTCAFSMKLPDI